MRVTVTVPETGEKYLVPNVYTSAAPLLLTTDGMPSYGQIMLSESIGTFVFVLTSLTARDYMKRQQENSSVIQGALVMAAGLMMVHLMCREVSGGIVNPSIALAKIIW